MLTVLLTCTVLMGSTFIPPKEWSVERVEVPRDLTYNTPWTGCTAGYPCTKNVSDPSAMVHLRRTIKAGEPFETPERCKVGVEEIAPLDTGISR